MFRIGAEFKCPIRIEELRAKLQVLGVSTKGSKAVLLERWRRTQSTHGPRNYDDDEEEESDQEDELATLRVGEIKDRLRKLNLKVTGKKDVLVERLRMAVKSENVTFAAGPSVERLIEARPKTKVKSNKSDFEESDDEDSDESHDSERDDRRGARTRSRCDAQPRSTLAFKNVEDALECFSGDGNQNVKRWISTFEDTAEMCGWTETQSVVYLKKLLRGSAKLFANYECHAKRWSKLKKSLIREFSETINSKQMHEQLRGARKKNEETYEEYVYRILELASHGDIEFEAKIQYIIDGIQDDEVNKVILYGASSVREFRKKLKQYETQQRNGRAKVVAKQPARNDRPDRTKKLGPVRDGTRSKRCFNCGSKLHLSEECPDKGKGPRCFNCNEFGHVATRCSLTRVEKKEKVRCDALGSKDKKTYKPVKILGREILAVLDSGSDLHLVRSSCYVKLGAPELELKTIPFDGVGAVNQRTLGRFNTEIEIDNIKFKFDFDVVPDQFLGHDLLIGGELSEYAEVRVKNRQEVLSRIENEGSNTSNSDGWREVLSISVSATLQDEPDVSIKHIVDKEVREEVRTLIENYTPEQTKNTGVTMRIVLQDDTPVFQNPQRLSAEQKRLVNEIVDEWISQEIIRPSVSDYASPIVLVAKKNGQVRLCVDYRPLNAKIIKDRNPLPLIEDQLDRLQDARVFTTLDLKDGFFHVPVCEESRKYTAFVVPDGHYEFLRVPFGLCNSPAVFQRHVRVVFRPLITSGTVLVYLDDLIIPARDERESLDKLKMVLRAASEYGLVLNWKKC